MATCPSYCTENKIAVPERADDPSDLRRIGEAVEEFTMHSEEVKDEVAVHDKASLTQQGMAVTEPLRRENRINTKFHRDSSLENMRFLRHCQANQDQDLGEKKKCRFSPSHANTH